MNNSEKIYYSFIHREKYEGSCPEYFNKEEYDWVKKIEDDYKIIENEYLNFFDANHQLKPYFAKGLVEKESSWRTYPLYTWGVKYYSKCQNFKNTIELLENIPGLVSASFNLLEPHSNIAPHYGDTNAIIRCHLGLEIPGELPQIGFEVNGKQRSWRKGEVLMFCDAYYHKAWNNTEKKRVILLFDVIRPEFIHKKDWICSRILASFLLQSIAQKLPFLSKSPLIIQYAMYQLAAVLAYIFVPVRNYVLELFYS